MKIDGTFGEGKDARSRGDGGRAQPQTCLLRFLRKLGRCSGSIVSINFWEKDTE